MYDIDADREDEDQTYEDDNAHQACYLFKPFSGDDLDHQQPAQKRRKVKHSSETETASFPLLNHGTEPIEFAQLRHNTFKELWHRKQLRIDGLVNKVEAEALIKIADFVNSSTASASSKLQTGLVISGPGGGTQTRLLERWRANQSDNTSDAVVQLRASHCNNLQTTLKNIIKSTISSKVGQDGFQEFLNKHKRLVPMNFDLELLQIFVEEHQVSKIVLSVLDVETFDIRILTELLSMLSSWSTTIPFIVLLGIATTVELFESRLPNYALDTMDATVFKLPSSNNILDQILVDIQNDSDQGVRFGPNTISAFEELTQSQSTTIDGFILAIKYAFMSHFFANSLSVLTSQSADLHADKSLCSAVRNTKSFQQYCENLLHKGKSSEQDVSRLLTDDASLLEASLHAVRSALVSDGIVSDSSSMQRLALTEATLINTRSLLQSFNPRPRNAIERALSRPADYLGCECCSQSSDATSIIHAPPTSILYNLLQEAGTTINVRDLYDAFCARAFLKDTHGQDDDDNHEEQNRGGEIADRQQLSVFYTALVELKMLGLVKSNTSAVVKRRAMASSGLGSEGMDSGPFSKGRDKYGDVDFIAKTGWIGL